MSQPRGLGRLAVGVILWLAASPTLRPGHGDAFSDPPGPALGQAGKQIEGPGRGLDPRGALPSLPNEFQAFLAGGEGPRMCFTATDPGEWRGADFRDPEGQPARACADFGTGTPGQMASRGGSSGLGDGPNPRDGPLSCRRPPNGLTRHPTASRSTKGAGRTRKDPSPVALQVGPFLWPERGTLTGTTTTSTHLGECAPRRVRTSGSAHPLECTPRRTSTTAIGGPNERLSDHGKCAPWRVRTSTSAHLGECAPRRVLTAVIGDPNEWLSGHDECAPRRVRTWASAHRGECAPERVRTAAIDGPNERLADHAECAPPRVRTWASAHRGECAPRRLSTAAIGGPNEWLSDHNECAPR